MSIIKRNATDSEVLDIQKHAELNKDEAEAALGSDKADRSGSANLQYHKKAAEPTPTPEPQPTPEPEPAPAPAPEPKEEPKPEEEAEPTDPPA